MHMIIKNYFFSFFCYSGRVQRVLLLEILGGLREEAGATADAGMLESGALEGKKPRKLEKSI